MEIPHNLNMTSSPPHTLTLSLSPRRSFQHQVFKLPLHRKYPPLPLSSKCGSSFQIKNILKKFQVQTQYID